MSDLPRNTILVGDALQRLKQLPSDAIDCCICSPPYYQLRSYDSPGQIGMEEDVFAWVERLRAVFAEVARVLKPTGSLWLNLGDSYSRHVRLGAPPKALLLAPERLLMALVADRWLPRNKIIWSKSNPMPVSVTDRLNTTYDYVYFLVREPRYYFDLDSIREPHRSTRKPSNEEPKPDLHLGPLAGKRTGLAKLHAEGRSGNVAGKNPGDVWRLPAANFRGGHFATFPERLVERPLLATCPERICTKCGEPWRRDVSVQRNGAIPQEFERDRLIRLHPVRYEVVRTIGDWRRCSCDAATRPGVVLDPFFGTGTVGVVAERLGRDWIGIELNPDYVELAEQRLQRARDGTRRPRAA